MNMYCQFKWKYKHIIYYMYVHVNATVVGKRDLGSLEPVDE